MVHGLDLSFEIWSANQYSALRKFDLRKVHWCGKTQTQGIKSQNNPSNKLHGRVAQVMDAGLIHLLKRNKWFGVFRKNSKAALENPQLQLVALLPWNAKELTPIAILSAW